jgi:hypothetical protein
MIRELKRQFHKLVCQIRGHKMKVIIEDIVLVCERCETTFLRNDLTITLKHG